MTRNGVMCVDHSQDRTVDPCPGGWNMNLPVAVDFKGPPNSKRHRALSPFLFLFSDDSCTAHQAGRLPRRVLCCRYTRVGWFVAVVCTKLFLLFPAPRRSISYLLWGVGIASAALSPPPPPLLLPELEAEPSCKLSSAYAHKQN